MRHGFRWSNSAITVAGLPVAHRVLFIAFSAISWRTFPRRITHETLASSSLRHGERWRGPLARFWCVLGVDSLSWQKRGHQRKRYEALREEFSRVFGREDSECYLNYTLILCHFG